MSKLKTIPQHIKQHIEFCGIEMEGYWENGHSKLKGDGSVKFDEYENEECHGECRDNCNCEEYCECEECRNCDHCDNNIIDCECDECLYCIDCSNPYEHCKCIIESVCDKKSCVLQNVCDECMEYFQENQQVERDCSKCDNIYNNCDMECNCECDCECDCEENNSVGEVTSGKLRVNEIEEFILNNYPNEVNSTCGLHIHLSFKNDKAAYNVICSRLFYNHFLSELHNWCNTRKINKNSRFIKRLDGVEYARKEFLGDEQIKEGNNRYTHINYCYEKFHTAEVRIGTMFDDKTISVEYVKKVIDIFNKYLSRVKPIIHKTDFNIMSNGLDDIDLKLRIQQQKNGLMIYAKSSNLQKQFRFYDDDKIQTEYHINHKIQFYENMKYKFNQSYNLSELDVYDSTKDENMPNISFLKVKGLNNGIKYYVKGIYTDNMIQDYIAEIENKIEEMLE